MRPKNNQGSVLVRVIIVLVVFAGAAVAFFLSTQRTARVKAASRDTAVDAVTGSVMISADGGYRDLPSEAAGKVAECNIKPGSHFKKGDVLVKLDTTELQRTKDETDRKYKSDKARAKIILDNNPEKKVATEKLANAKRLFLLGNASDDEVNTAQRALDAITTKLSLTDFDDKKGEEDYRLANEGYDLLLKKMEVRAPFDGTIEGALTWEGALITVGTPVARVFSRSRVVAAKIGEESFGRVKVGQSARLRLLTYGSQNYEATVSELLPTADDAQRFTVYLDVKVDPDLLKPGSSGEVTITVAQRPNAVMIQRRGLFDANKLFVVKDGRVQKREVEVGFVALNIVEIRKGIEVGDQVIVDRLEEFRAGQRVRVEVEN